MANSKCRWDPPQEWKEWSEWLAAGLHARNRWRLPVLLTGMLFAGGYTKKPFLRRVLRLSSVIVVGRLRKDAALRSLPPKQRRRGRGRPRIS